MNQDNVSIEQTDRIVIAGIELLKAITAVNGPTEGHKLWESISDTLGEEVKYAIFLAMLTGKSSSNITIKGDLDFRERRGGIIELIKLIRKYTGDGLKDSKGMADSLNDGRDVILEVKFKHRNIIIEELSALGFQAM